MTVVGIDPGLAATGYGVVEAAGGRLCARASGVIETAAGLPLEVRLARLAQALRELLADHRPQAVAFEEIYFGRNSVSAFADMPCWYSAEPFWLLRSRNAGPN